MQNQKLSENQKKDFMKKAAFIADNSLCNYKVGCVGVIKDVGQQITHHALNDPYVRRKRGFIYVKSWNETLKGEIYCQNFDKDGKRICVRVEENLKGSKDIHKVCSSHAEIGLIAKCARYGIPTEEMIVFQTNSPCYICAKALIQAKISELYYMAKHTDTSGLEILKKNGISTKIIRQDSVF